MKKLYYSIGEVSELLGEEQHILRHWEKTFTFLKPKKNSGGMRAYSAKDIDVLNAIKILLRHELMPMKDAKDKLGNRRAVEDILSKHKDILSSQQSTKTDPSEIEEADQGKIYAESADKQISPSRISSPNNIDSGTTAKKDDENFEIEYSKQDYLQSQKASNDQNTQSETSKHNINNSVSEIDPKLILNELSELKLVLTEIKSDIENIVNK